MESNEIMTNGKDMDQVFEMLKANMPIPDEQVKEAVLNVFTYLLSM